jgi:hypothetical protein
LPCPSRPSPSAAAASAALRASEPALREDLDEAFVADLDHVRPEWPGELLEALTNQLEDGGTHFYDALESLSFGLLRARKPTSGWQHALLLFDGTSFVPVSCLSIGSRTSTASSTGDCF